GALPCGNPQGPDDDATIAPYGAGSSIVFLPGESISTLKHYFQNTDLWRYLFGFGDAYNPSNATVNGYWYNHSYFGIDQGPMLIMIENYRSGLIWKYFMQNEDIQKALLTIFPYTGTILTFTDLKPIEISTRTAPYDAELLASGSNFKNVNKITFEWSGETSGSTTWNKGDASWNERVNVESDNSMTLRPRVVEEDPTWSGTVNWTVTLKDTTGETASRDFTVIYYYPHLEDVVVYPNPFKPSKGHT
ncbi:MAG: glucoamylase family protein, partial [bacterium]|nr:glucoamylase family protein [bacterium]